MAVRGALWAGLVAVLVAAPAARAEVVYNESPRTGALRLELGGYKPNIGSTNGVVSDPYEAVFGAEAMLLFSIDYDWYLWKEFGTAGITFSAGYAEKFGQASVLGAEGELTGVPTGLHVLPLKLMALYNFDWLAFELGIPFVPYVRGGLAYVPWWSTEGDEVEFSEGDRGAGASWGVTGSVGVSLLLDVLDRRMARDFDAELGVNHTYLYAEYNVLQADDFGAGLDLSDDYWMFGIAFEF